MRGSNSQPSYSLLLRSLSGESEIVIYLAKFDRFLPKGYLTAKIRIPANLVQAKSMDPPLFWRHPFSRRGRLIFNLVVAHGKVGLSEAVWGRKPSGHAKISIRFQYTPQGIMEGRGASIGSRDDLLLLYVPLDPT